MRRIFPTSVSSRCGLGRTSGRGDSPAPPSPQLTYRTPHSASPGRAAGLKLKSPSGWMRVLSATRSSSRAVPSKRRVRTIAVDPFDQHAFACDGTGRCHCGRRQVAGQLQAGQIGVVRRRRRVEHRIFDVNGVELAVLRVVRIELERDDAVAEANFVGELVEEAAAAVAAVEIEIRRQVLAGLVEDVDGAVEIDEKDLALSLRAPRGMR